MPQHEILRPLGPTERFFLSRSSLRLYHSVGVTASYHCPSFSRDVDFLKQLIYSSLAAVINIQPQMSIVPVGRFGEFSSGASFARLPEIDLWRICAFFDSAQQLDPGKGRFEELDKILQMQHDQPLADSTSELPLWRLAILYDPSDPTRFTASLIFNHVLFDTRSGRIFHECFAAALSDPYRKPLASTNIQTPKFDLLPSFEDLFDYDHSQDVMDELKHTIQSPPNLPDGFWSGSPYQLPLKTRITTRFVSKDITHGFVLACRNHNCSVTSTLQALIIANLFSALPSSFTSVKCANAVSLRSWLRHPIDAKYMGIFVSIYEELFHRQSFSWSQARSCKLRIDDIVAKKGAGLGVAFFSAIDDMYAYHKSKIGKQRTMSLDLSNIGVLGPQPEDQCWRLGTEVFSQSASVCGGAFRPSVATGGDGRLSISWVWQESVVDEGIMERVVEGVMAGIEELARGSGRSDLEEDA